MDSTKVDAQNAGDLDHSWSGDHSARNSGLWNNWVPAKTEQCMGYFTRNDLPFNYALADAFTICDGYHQSILGPTSPNRMYFWTGTSSGRTSNPPDYTVQFSNVTTYPELLLNAGVSWQVYTNHEAGDGSGANGWVGDYGDTPLWFYQAYQTSMNATTAPLARQLRRLLRRDHHGEHERRFHPPLRRPDRLTPRGGAGPARLTGERGLLAGRGDRRGPVNARQRGWRVVIVSEAPSIASVMCTVPSWTPAFIAAMTSSGPVLSS